MHPRFQLAFVIQASDSKMAFRCFDTTNFDSHSMILSNSELYGLIVQEDNFCSTICQQGFPWAIANYDLTSIENLCDHLTLIQGFVDLLRTGVFLIV
jgi:hypothetical protein